jgi:hypothetical protein
VTPVQHAYHEELEYYEGRAHCASTAAEDRERDSAAPVQGRDLEQALNRERRAVDVHDR